MNTIERLEIEVERREEPDPNGEVKRRMLAELLAKWLERAYRVQLLLPKESAEIPQNDGRKPLIYPHTRWDIIPPPLCLLQDFQSQKLPLGGIQTGFSLLEFGPK